MALLDTIDPGNSGGSVRIPDRIEVEARPVTYPCDRCDRVFDDVETLRTHRLEDHKIHRPLLLIKGCPNHTDSYYLTKALGADDLVFLNTESIEIEGIGLCSAEEAGEILAASANSRQLLALTSQGYTVRYELRIAVLSDQEAEQVEKLFLQCCGERKSLLDLHDTFNKKSSMLNHSTRAYISALSSYIVGLMAKSRMPGCQIAYEEYPAKLGGALDKLRNFQRPLALTLVSLLRLMHNNFALEEVDSVVPVIGVAKRSLGQGILPGNSSSADSTLVIPVDYFTGRIIRFATADEASRKAEFSEFRELALAPKLPEQDRMKMNLLLLASYCKQDPKAADEMFAKLRYVPAIADYAEKIYGRKS